MKKATFLVIGSSLVVSMTAMASANTTPFAANKLTNGYASVTQCADKDTTGKCSSSDDKGTQGKCGAGKCAPGKCGGSK